MDPDRPQSLLSIRTSLILFTGLLVATVSDVNAQSDLTLQDVAEVPSPLPIQRIQGPIELDGVVDEPAWEEIDPLPMTMHAPTFGIPGTEFTEVRVAYDDEYLYVSGKMFDSEPSGIRTNTLFRNQYSGDDLMAVIIDTFNDHETALWFTTNPEGNRIDRTISNDAVSAGGQPFMNFDWNAHWDVETSRSDEGWFAEFRIPFSTLGFQVENGQVTMGLSVYRFIARKNERQTFPAVDPGIGGMAFARPSQAHRIVLEDVSQPTPVFVTPYLTSGVTWLPDPSGEELPAGAPSELQTDPTWEVGGDVRFSPSSNLTLDVTVNTDFAQVEADEEQVNLTRFPLFFPEKRQFFQERASTFQFSSGRGSDRLFNSRNLGLVDGEIVRIYGGLRAVGRIGGTDYGFLNMQTAASETEPGENMGVFRARQQVLNQYSTVGGMVTSRLGGDRDNMAYGLDANLRLFGDEWMQVRWAQTFDEAVEEESPLEAGLLRLRWERVRDAGLSYAGEFMRVGRDYRPGLGFQTRHDVHFLGARAQYKRFHDAESSLRSTSVDVGTQHFLRNREGSASTRTLSPGVTWEFKGGTEFRLRGGANFENPRSPFTVGDATILPGEYWFYEGELEYRRPNSARFRGSASVVAGTFYDGNRLGASWNPTWNPSQHLELGGGVEINRLEFSERDVSTTTRLARARVRIALNTQISFSTLVQYSNVDEMVSVNARFRYHFREGTDLWVVLNEGRHTRSIDALGTPLPGSAGGNLMIKYTHTTLW